MSSIQTGINSQKKLCAHMRRPLLEELVKRVFMITHIIDGRTHKISKFVEDFMYVIENSNDSHLSNGLVIQTVFKKSDKYSNPPDYYIVITFIAHGIQLGHITFHLVYTNCSRINTTGPLHIVNNQSSKRVRRLYIKEDSELANCIVIYIGDMWIRSQNINSNLYKLSEYAVDVMNNYLKSKRQHPLSLENRRADNVQLDEQTQNYINDIIKLNARCFRGGTRRLRRGSRRRPRKVRTTTVRGHGLC